MITTNAGKVVLSMPIKDLIDKAEKGDMEAKKKYDKIMECIETMDEYRVANCIILMKELIPELQSQIAMMIKNFVVNKDRSLRYLSKDEIEFIKFLRAHLKTD